MGSASLWPAAPSKSARPAIAEEPLYDHDLCSALQPVQIVQFCQFAELGWKQIFILTAGHVLAWPPACIGDQFTSAVADGDADAPGHHACAGFTQPPHTEVLNCLKLHPRQDAGMAVFLSEIEEYQGHCPEAVTASPRRPTNRLPPAGFPHGLTGV